MTYSASVRILGGLEPALFRLLEIDGESFSRCADLRFRRFLGHWGDLAATRGAYPPKAALDPPTLGQDILPNLFLLDIERTEGRPFRYRFRLAGGAITDLERIRPGLFLDEIAAAELTAIERQYAAAIRGEVYLRESTLGWRDKRFWFKRSSTLVLPLANDGKTPTHLFGLSVYDDWHSNV